MWENHLNFSVDFRPLKTLEYSLLYFSVNLNLRDAQVLERKEGGTCYTWIVWFQTTVLLIYRVDPSMNSMSVQDKNIMDKELWGTTINKYVCVLANFSGTAWHKQHVTLHQRHAIVITIWKIFIQEMTPGWPDVCLPHVLTLFHSISNSLPSRSSGLLSFQDSSR